MRGRYKCRARNMSRIAAVDVGALTGSPLTYLICRTCWESVAKGLQIRYRDRARLYRTGNSGDGSQATTLHVDPCTLFLETPPAPSVRTKAYAYK